MHLAQPWWHPVAAVAPYSGLTPSASRPGVMKRCAAPPNSTPESQAFIVPPQCRHHVCVLCLKETFTSPGQYAPALTLQCMEIHKLEHLLLQGNKICEICQQPYKGAYTDPPGKPGPAPMGPAAGSLRGVTIMPQSLIQVSVLQRSQVCPCSHLLPKPPLHPIYRLLILIVGHQCVDPQSIAPREPLPTLTSLNLLRHTKE